MANIDDFMAPGSFKASDFEAGPRSFSIGAWRSHQFQDSDRPSLILEFHGEDKTLVCNKTNMERIAICLGSRDPDQWKGKTITLTKEWTEFKGKPVEAVRVVMPQPGQPAAPVMGGAQPPTGSDDIPF